MKLEAALQVPKRLAALSLLLLGGGVAQAASLSALDQLDQSQFRELSQNIGAASAYRAITPAEPLGTLGFDVGLSITATSLDEDLFDLASEGEYNLNQFLLPRLSVHKGLPFQIDLGASLAGVPGTDFRVIGAEIRKALMEGSMTMPAVAARVSYSMVQGADELDVSNIGADVSISKGFAMATPYAGIGAVRTTSTPNDSATLEEETFNQSRVFFGVNVNFGINFVFEVDRIEDYNSISVKTGLRF